MYPTKDRNHGLCCPQVIEWRTECLPLTIVFLVDFPPSRMEKNISDFNLKESIRISCGMSWSLSRSSFVTLNVHRIFFFFVPSTGLVLLSKHSHAIHHFSFPFLHFKWICLTTSVPLNSAIVTSDYGIKAHETYKSIVQDKDKLCHCFPLCCFPEKSEKGQ